MLRRAVRKLARACGYDIVAFPARPPAVGQVAFGDLRSLEPVSRSFGLDRGTSIFRHYIHEFLNAHRAVITGRILEVAEARYAAALGASDARIDVLFPRAGHPGATLVGDRASGVGIPLQAYDTIILTQVLSHIYAMKEAVGVVHRALKPNGIVLATFSGTTQVSRFDMDRWGDYWHVTDLAVRRMFEEVFPPPSVEVTSYGNVLSAVAALSGVAAEELTAVELSHRDSDYPVLVAVVARKTAVPA
jgi:hypothetical protein